MYRSSHLTVEAAALMRNGIMVFNPVHMRYSNLNLKKCIHIKFCIYIVRFRVISFQALLY